jgi:6-phosphogluconolactonase/glucosamine-6-phosphate isomerase/deaminase
VPHDHEDSNYRLAREALLDRVGAANATHLMRCAEVDAYQLRIGDLGRFDLIHLGLGPDGHTASLFPQSPALEADPGRLVTLNTDPLGNNPYERMTLTFAGIARARQVVFTVMGEDKAEALAKVAAGEDVPAARVRAERCIWIVDRRAAERL